MTNKPQVKIVNCETGEEIIQDANAAQIAEFEQIATDKETVKAEAEAKAAQKTALLERLGISEDEARLLLS